MVCTSWWIESMITFMISLMSDDEFNSLPGNDGDDDFVSILTCDLSSKRRVARDKNPVQLRRLNHVYTGWWSLTQVISCSERPSLRLHLIFAFSAPNVGSNGLSFLRHYLLIFWHFLNMIVSSADRRKQRELSETFEVFLARLVFKVAHSRQLPYKHTIIPVGRHASHSHRVKRILKSICK